MGEPVTIPTAPTRPVDEGEGGVPAVATGRSWRRRRRPPTLRTFLVLSGVYLAAVVALGVWMASRNGGTFTYPLDDPYIHLALADNLVHHGSWGVTPGVFESASSSPAWTLLVSGGMVALPVRDVLVPLVLSVGSGLLLVWQIAALDPFCRLPWAWRWIGLAAAAVPLGLLHLTFVGMEHLLHAALVLAIVTRIDALVEPGSDAGARHRRRVALWLLALAAAVRMETLFLAAGLALALAAVPPRTGTHGIVTRVRRGIPVVVAAGIPVAAMAAVNLVFGHYPIANSVMVKTSLADPGKAAFPQLLLEPQTYGTALSELVKAPEVAVLLIGVGLLAIACRDRRWPAWQVAAVAVLVAAALNVVLGNLGWYGRYNAYLVAACYGVLFPLAADPNSVRAVAAVRRLPGRGLTVGVLALVLFAAPVQLLRASWLPTAGSEIYRQQGQMARFLADSYAGEAVAVSDLGFVAWRHDGPEVDLWGLASIEVVRALRGNRYDVAFMDALVREHGVRAIVIYDSWFEDQRDGVPGSWVPVEEWCLEGGTIRIVGRRCVTWYGPTADDAAELRRRLDDGRSLPGGTSYRRLDGRPEA